SANRSRGAKRGFRPPDGVTTNNAGPREAELFVVTSSEGSSFEWGGRLCRATLLGRGLALPAAHREAFHGLAGSGNQLSEVSFPGKAANHPGRGDFQGQVRHF